MLSSEKQIIQQIFINIYYFFIFLNVHFVVDYILNSTGKCISDN